MDSCRYINLFQCVIHRVSVLSVFMWDLCYDEFWRIVFNWGSFLWFLFAGTLSWYCLVPVFTCITEALQLELLKFQPRHHIFRKALSDLQSAQLKSQWNGTKGITEAQSLKLISWFFRAFSTLSMTADRAVR